MKVKLLATNMLGKSSLRAYFSPMVAPVVNIANQRNLL